MSEKIADILGGDTETERITGILDENTVWEAKCGYTGWRHKVGDK